MKIAELLAADPLKQQLDAVKRQERAVKLRKAAIKAQQAQKHLRDVRNGATKTLS
jgi:hypothetical protein